MGDTLTLTYWTTTAPDGALWRWSEAEGPGERARESYAAGHSEPVAVTREYRVGDEVQVDAFARWRIGKVTKLLRSRVRVEYVRNGSGTRATRDFGALQVLPAGEILPLGTR